jgi:type IV pilus assembly protein PilA
VKQSSKGFTLIEVMIVAAIIGILGAVALPAYQDYTVRTKVAEVVLALSGCRTTISEVYQSGGSAPAPNEWGCEGASSKFVASIVTDADGVVSATVRNIKPGDPDGRTVTLIPTISGAPASAAADIGRSITGWICGGAGTTVNRNYLPGSCRG